MPTKRAQEKAQDVVDYLGIDLISQRISPAETEREKESKLKLKIQQKVSYCAIQIFPCCHSNTVSCCVFFTVKC